MFPGALGISEFKFRVTFGPELLPLNWQTGQGCAGEKGKDLKGWELPPLWDFFLSVAFWRCRWKLGFPLASCGLYGYDFEDRSCGLHLSAPVIASSQGMLGDPRKVPPPQPGFPGDSIWC